MDKPEDRQLLGIAVLLAGITIWTYSPALNHGFINYDDPLYVLQNPQVRAGLTLSGIEWAFGTLFYFYHPLTWLSLMMDVQVFGTGPFGFHLTNVLLHAANVILLLLWLVLGTGAVWRSALVALLFALHPVNVETVAWISERKGLLSTFFFFATIWLYMKYTRNSSWLRYSGVIALYGCSLMSKSTFVTLPGVLLLLDFWPLKRFGLLSRLSDSRPTRPIWEHGYSGKLRSLVLEKTPFLAMSAAFSILTIVAESRAGALSAIDVDFPVRIANSLISCLHYVEKYFWPTQLALVYPQTASPSPGELITALFVLVIVTTFAVHGVFRRPAFFVGWFLFLIILAPVSGIVQIGWHSMADRYAYVPLIGISIAILWRIPTSWSKLSRAPTVVSVTAIILTVSLCMVVRSYLRTWKSTITVFQNAVEATTENFVAHSNLSVSLAEHGYLVEAIHHAQAALAINPTRADHHYNLGRMFFEAANYRACRSSFRMARELDPDDPAAIRSLAWLLAVVPDPKIQRSDEAVRLAEVAVCRGGENPTSLDLLGVAFAAAGRFDEAMKSADKAISLAHGSGKQFVTDMTARRALYAQHLPFQIASASAAPAKAKQ